MATQYTIRGVSDEIDTKLRRLARLKGESLNKVVLDQLSLVTSNKKDKTSNKKPKVNTDFDDLFGIMTPLDSKTEVAIKDQRKIYREDWQ